MKLNKNSWHARLYNAMYKTEYRDAKLPGSLCPYFWALVLSLTLVIPLGMLALPTLIWNKLMKDDAGDGRLIAQAGMGIFLYIILFLVYVMITPIIWLFIPNPSENFTEIATVGLIMIIIGIIITIVVLIKKYYDNKRYISYRNDEEEKEKQPNIFVAFIKAKYNKYCPKIDWK